MDVYSLYTTTPISGAILFEPRKVQGEIIVKICNLGRNGFDLVGEMVIHMCIWDGQSEKLSTSPHILTVSCNHLEPLVTSQRGFFCQTLWL